MDLFDYAHPAPVAEQQRFVIHRGIPIPKGREAPSRAEFERPALPFDRMEVDECFDVWPHDLGGLDLIRVQNYVSGAASTFRSKDPRGRSFTTRQIQGQFVRCWRVK